MMAKVTNVVLLAVGLALVAFMLFWVIGSWGFLGRMCVGDSMIFIGALVLGCAAAGTGYLGLLIQKR